MAKKPTDQQRALWTFLITTLAAPLLAAVIVLVAGALLGVAGRWLSADVAAADMAGRMRWAAGLALQGFVWSAWPAALTGAVMAGLVIVRGEVGWLAASIAGAVSASLFGMLAGKALAPHLTAIAFIGACLGLVLWRGLTRAGILRG